MRPECITAVTKAIGRALNAAEIKGIEDRISRHMRQNAIKDPNGALSMSPEQRLYDAATSAAKELVYEAQKKKQRVAQTILAHDRIQRHLEQFPDMFDGLDRMIAFHADGKANTLSVESRARAIERDALRQMLDTLEATNPKFFGLLENPEGVQMLVKELHGQKTGDADAAQGSKVFHEIAARLRERFNRSGGDVGQLDDWGMPHHHSQAQVAKAGRQQWATDVLPLLDRKRYVNEDGSRMTDAEVGDFLGHAWASIATGGVNKLEPGRGGMGSGMRANRGNESRQVHFKDGEAYIQYQQKYGERSLYEVLTGHIAGVSKDIALVETFGPNPDLAYSLFRDRAVKEQTLNDPTKVGRLQKRAISSENLYNYVAGRTQPVASARLAETFDTLRSWMTASRLGSAVITSFSDDATMYLSAHVNKLPAMRLFANELAALNPANRMEKRMAMRAGLAMNTLLSSLNRFGADTFTSDAPGFLSGLSNASTKLAGATLRASGLNALTEARKRAYGVTFMHALGAVTKDHKSLSALDAADHRILLSKGITETDFAVWKQAQQEDWGGGNDSMLTPDAIYRIPDAEMAKVVAPEVAARRADLDKQIAELDSRNQQEQDWLDKRQAQYQNAQADAVNAIEKLTQEKGAEATAAANALRARGELMQAEIDLAIASREQATAAAQTSAADRMRGLMARAAGAGNDLGGLIENRADTAAAAAVGQGFTAGREVGQRIGSLQRRIVELEARAIEAERAAGQAVNAKSYEVGRRLSKMGRELGEFTKRSQDRQRRREAVMQSLDQSMPDYARTAIIRAREDGATRLLGVVLEETDVAVIEPGAKERAMMMSGLQRGTWKGELTRSFFLFKSFPIAMMTRHIQRGWSMPTGTGRAAYIASLIASTTVMGAVSLQINEMLGGRDPRDITDPRFGVAAMLKGGSLGLYGDFLFSESSRYGQSPFAAALGPVAGLAEDVLKLTQGNLMEAAEGKDTHAGAEAVRFVKSNTPGANLWYSKAALDHLLFHQLQEYFSPGYLRKMRRRSEKEFGQKYWWEPGDVVPDRAPDMAAMAGETA